MNAMAVVLAFAMLGARALATESHEITGKLRAVSEKSIVIETDRGLIDFRRELLDAPMPKGLQSGDVVSIRYVFAATHVTKLGRKQRAGKVAPRERRKSAPQTDDRAFYPA